MPIAAQKQQQRRIDVLARESVYTSIRESGRVPGLVVLVCGSVYGTGRSDRLPGVGTCLYVCRTLIPPPLPAGTIHVASKNDLYIAPLILIALTFSNA